MEKIKGIIVPMVTPLSGQDKLDEEGIVRLVERLVGGGVSALFLLGTTGEAPSLSGKTKYDFVDIVCKQVSGRLPVLVGVTDTSMTEAIALSRHAEDCGAAGVVAAAPYYYFLSSSDMVTWFTILADKSPLPVYLYNMPGNVKMFMDLPVVMELSGHPNMAGIKDSSANMTYFASLAHNFAGTDFALYMGPEEQTAAAVMMGADGGVNGGANLFPELYTGIYKAAVAGDLAAVRSLQNKIMSLSASLYGLIGDSSSYLCGLKCALEVLGICEGYVSMPYTRFGYNLKKTVSDHLKQLNI